MATKAVLTLRRHGLTADPVAYPVPQNNHPARTIPTKTPTRNIRPAQDCATQATSVTLANTSLLSVSDIPISSITSAFSRSIIDHARNPYAYFQAWASSSLLDVIAVGVTMLFAPLLVSR